LNGSGCEADSGQGASRSAPCAKAKAGTNAHDHFRSLVIADPASVLSVVHEWCAAGRTVEWP
jgi:hypothetical protein